MRSRLRHVLRPSWSSRCLHGESISTVGNMEGFDAEKDEDDGYKKPAGPWWAYAGVLIGFGIGGTLLLYLISRHH
jgi:hypothetical protein